MTDRGRRSPGSSAVRRVRSVPGKVREAGPAYTAYRSLQMIAPRVFRVDRFTVYERPLGTLRARDDDPEVRWAGRDDVDLLAALGLPAAVVEALLARGDRACLLLSGGEPLAQVWFSFRVYEDAGLRFPLAPDEAWAHDAKVAPAHRGRGGYLRLMRTALADLAGEGVTRTLSAVDDLNRNARRAIARSGARPLCGILLIRVGTVSAVRARRWRDVRWRLFMRHLDVAAELYRPGLERAKRSA